MEFDVIGFDNKDLWEIITQNREVYYQWQYVDAFFQIGDGIPKLAYAKNKDNCAMLVFLLRNISKDLKLENSNNIYYYDIVTPYGYGGLDIENKDSTLIQFFFNEFEKYCRNNKIISEFLRFNPLIENQLLYNNQKYDIINNSKTVYIKLENKDQIWNDMESRCRNTIRKAQKNNLYIKSGFDKELFNEFISIYKETMSRDDAKEYYYFNEDFYNSMYNNLKSFATIYNVYYEDKAINSSIIIYNGKNAHYHLSGTLTDYLQLGANSFALYQIANDLCEKGYKKFHLGGGYGGDLSPLLKFKKSFNKNGELDFYIGKRIFDEEVYEYLCKIRKLDADSDFFPAYRKML